MLLAGLVLVTLLPAAAMSVALVWHSYLRDRETAERSALATARALAASVDQSLTELRPALNALAASPALASGDLATFRVHADTFLRTAPSAANITVVHPDGLQVLNTARPADAPPLPARPDMMVLFGGGEVAVSGVFPGRVVGKPLVAVAVPAKVDGQVRYLVGAGMQVSALDQVVNAPRLPPSWTVSVTDPQGFIATRVPPRPEFVGQRATPQLLEGTARGAEGTFAGITKDGTRVFATFARGARSGYVVAIGIPEDELTLPMQQRAMAVGAGIFLILLAGLGSAAAIVRRVSRAARQIAAAAVGRGAAPSPGKLGFREAEQVRLGLSITAAETQSLAAELEELKKELTRPGTGVLAAVLVTSSEPMYIADARAAILLQNQAARDRFGYTDKEAFGMRLSQLFASDGDTQAQGEAEENPTGHVRTRGGGQLAVQAHSSPFTVGGTTYLVVTFRERQVPVM